MLRIALGDFHRRHRWGRFVPPAIGPRILRTVEIKRSPGLVDLVFGRRILNEKRAPARRRTMRTSLIGQLALIAAAV